MGVKKSTVCTKATSSDRRYTPASSALSKPTSTFGSSCRANFPSTASSAAGLSLLAQPAALTCSVNRIGFASATAASVNTRERKTNQPRINTDQRGSKTGDLLDDIQAGLRGSLL